MNRVVNTAIILISLIVLCWCHYTQMSRYEERISDLEVITYNLSGKVMLLENKMSLSIKVQDGMVFLRDPVSKFTFDYDKE